MRPFIFLLALTGSASFAHATEPELSPLQRPSRPMREAAQTHYQSGARFFESSQYDAALVEFEAAWRLSGEPDLLHNLSWTHEKAGRIKEAIDYAVRYQTAAQTVEDQERGRRRVEFLKQRYASGATEPTTAPSSPSVSSSPAQAPQPVPEKAPSAAPEPPKTESRHRVPPLSIGLLAGGGALALGGIGCLAGAWSTSQQGNNTDLTCAEGSALSSRGHALNATGIALTVVGGAVVVGGATWAILARSLGHPAKAVTSDDRGGATTLSGGRAFLP